MSDLHQSPWPGNDRLLLFQFGMMGVDDKQVVHVGSASVHHYV